MYIMVPFGLVGLIHCLFAFSCLQGLLDLMIAEEEELKKRVLKSIESCRKELSILYSELQMPPFEVFTFEKCV